MKHMRDMTALAVVLLTLLPVTANGQELVPAPMQDPSQPVYEQAPGAPQPISPQQPAYPEQPVAAPPQTAYAPPPAYAPAASYGQSDPYAQPPAANYAQPQQPAYAQPAAYLPTAGSPAPEQGEAAAMQPLAYSQEQLDQMLAPIALYPDPLIAQILMASAYPLEVVEASRWLQNPQNAGLKADALQAALVPLPWDPSVKSLVPFPSVLNMLDSNLQWTEQIGDAFLANQPAVMDSVQRLRQLARARGNLASTPQQTVSQQEGAIVIQPAQPQYVYVPYYNPTVVYGAWPWAAYPPYYFPPPPGYVYTTVGLFGFGIGLVVADWLWGWDRWDWHRHVIDIDNNRFAFINDHRPPAHAGTWEFDPAHRHSVPFRSTAVRQQFDHTEADTRRSVRGFPARSAAQATPAAVRAGERPAAAQRPVTAARPAETFTGGGVRPGATVAPARPAVTQPSVQRPMMPQVAQPYRQPAAMPAHAAAPAHFAAPGRGGPLYESFSRGPDVREQSMRGATSRATMQAPVQHAAPAPQQHAAPAPQAHGNPGNGQQNMRTR